MIEAKKPHAYAYLWESESQSGGTRSIRIEVQYDHAIADISIRLAEPVPPHTNRAEIARIEIHSLIEALEVVAESSSNISVRRPPQD